MRQAVEFNPLFYPKATGSSLSDSNPSPACVTAFWIGTLAAWVGPFVETVLLIIGYRFWQTGLRYYSGTGTQAITTFWPSSCYRVPHYCMPLN
jgi:hypothetical protein